MKTNFWRKLDALLKSRLPLLDSLELLGRESRDVREKAQTDVILERLRAGASLSGAVEGTSVAADASVKGILLAGERIGELPGSVRQIAERLESREKMRSQIIGASFYPALVMALCVVLCFILSLVVLPKFEKLFVTLGVGGTLPPLTRGVMGFGNFLKNWGLWLVPAIIGVVVILRFLIKPAAANAFLWRIPLIGELWCASARENFLGTLGLLLKSGAPLDEALQVVARAMAKTPLEAVAHEATERIAQGERLSVALRGCKIFEESQISLIALSETGGNLSENCEHLSGLEREALQIRLKTVFSILEPSLVIFMAGFVVLLVVALFLPLGPLVSRLAEGG